MGKYKTLAKNTGFVFVGTIGSKLIGFIMLPLYTHWLSPSEFGAVDTMNTYVMFIIGFVCLCIPDSIFIFPRNVDDRKKSEYFSSGLCFSVFALLISAILFYVVGHVMLAHGIENVFSNYVWLIYGLMVSTYFQNYFQSFTRSLDKMFHYSMAGIVLTIAIAVFSILLIPLYGLYGYAYALIIAHIAAASYSFLSTRSYRFLTIHTVTVSSVKEMLMYSAPLLPNSIMWWLVDGVNRPVMEGYLGLVAIGIYAVAQKFSGLLYSMLNILTLAWGNSALDEYGKPGFDEFYNNYLKILATTLVIGAIFICGLSRPLVHLFTTPEYYEAYKYIPILMTGVIFSGLSGTVGGVFSAVKKSHYFFYSSVYGGIASISFLLILTPLYGLMGTVCSVGISFFAMLIARILYSKKYAKIYDISFYIKLILAYLLIAVIEIKIMSNYRYILYLIVMGAIILMCKRYLIQIIDVIISKMKILKK